MTDDQIESWELGYQRWQKYHSLAFGWEGPQGKESAHALFMYWEKLFFVFIPTERELEDATDWAVGERDTFQAKWQEHYAIIRGRILSVREETKPQMTAIVALLETSGPKNLTASRIRDELAEKLSMPK